MKLYFAPLACSMASRISLEETNLDVEYVEVCPLTKKTLADDADYLEVNPLGLVPALMTDDGTVVTENIAVLTAIAEASGQMPTAPAESARIRQWLSFVATELHKGIFSVLFDPSAPEVVRTFAQKKAAHRLAHVDAELADRTYVVGDRFSVADAYLVTVLNWAQATPIDLSVYPNVARYLKRHLERPSVSSSVAHELPLYRAEKRRERERAARSAT